MAVASLQARRRSAGALQLLVFGIEIGRDRRLVRQQRGPRFQRDGKRRAGIGWTIAENAFCAQMVF
jgi:hypothetical protein